MLQVCEKAIGRGLEVAKVYDGDRGEFHQLATERSNGEGSYI
jgi:hypothetical protein